MNLRDLELFLALSWRVFFYSTAEFLTTEEIVASRQRQSYDKDAPTNITIKAIDLNV